MSDDDDALRSQNRSLCNALATAQARAHVAEQRCQILGEIVGDAERMVMGLLTSTGPDRMCLEDRRVLIQVAERLRRVLRMK